jgi:hypothetical protein
MKLIYALSIAFVLGATPALADDPSKYEPKILPKCKLVKAADGTSVCAYTLEVWVKKVLPVDAELVSKRNLLELEQQKTSLLGEQKTSLIEQVRIYAESQGILMVRTVKLTKDVIDLDKKYQNERVRSGWGSPLAWTAAAVSTAILAGYVIANATD